MTLTIEELGRWKVAAMRMPDGRRVVEVTVSTLLSSFEANRLARAVQLASDHLETT